MCHLEQDAIPEDNKSQNHLESVESISELESTTISEDNDKTTQGTEEDTESDGEIESRERAIEVIKLTIYVYL